MTVLCPGLCMAVLCLGAVYDCVVSSAVYGCVMSRVVMCQLRCVDSLPLTEYSLDLVPLIVSWPVSADFLSVIAFYCHLQL